MPCEVCPVCLVPEFPRLSSLSPLWGTQDSLIAQSSVIYRLLCLHLPWWSHKASDGCEPSPGPASSPQPRNNRGGERECPGKRFLGFSLRCGRAPLSGTGANDNSGFLKPTHSEYNLHFCTSSILRQHRKCPADFFTGKYLMSTSLIPATHSM